MIENQQDVEQIARARLCHSGYAELRNVTCAYEEHNRVLTLRGRVSPYYVKQRAQETVRMVDGVERVDNLVEVADR